MCSVVHTTGPHPRRPTGASHTAGKKCSEESSLGRPQFPQVAVVRGLVGRCRAQVNTQGGMLSTGMFTVHQRTGNWSQREECVHTAGGNTKITSTVQKYLCRNTHAPCMAARPLTRPHWGGHRDAPSACCSAAPPTLLLQKEGRRPNIFGLPKLTVEPSAPVGTGYPGGSRGARHNSSRLAARLTHRNWLNPVPKPVLGSTHSPTGLSKGNLFIWHQGSHEARVAAKMPVLTATTGFPQVRNPSCKAEQV